MQPQPVRTAAFCASRCPNRVFDTHNLFQSPDKRLRYGEKYSGGFRLRPAGRDYGGPVFVPQYGTTTWQARRTRSPTRRILLR
jgi:hypothetical protein